MFKILLVISAAAIAGLGLAVSAPVTVAGMFLAAFVAGMIHEHRTTHRLLQ